MTSAATPRPPARPQDVDSSTPFPAYLETFRACLVNVFHHRENLDLLSTSRGLPPYVLREIMACSPLATFIPTAYGGRGGDPQEAIALVEAAAYESLALGLIFGINLALFIQPVAKYGQPEVRAAVLEDFVQHRKMGGLMITEPGHGSDALHMQTAWSEEDGHCRIRGTKHWAGLTGWADYWLLTARHTVPPRGLGRDIDFFICDANLPGQRVVVEEVYQNLGLAMIPYGRNRIDVLVPAAQRLVPYTTGIKMMLDLLHRSRLEFPSMAMGFLHRLLDEATRHCRERLVGGRPLHHYDQVQARLARIQSAFTICSAMCVNAVASAGLDRDLAPHGLEANAIKAFVTDLMQEAAQSLLQLIGAKGYRCDHFAGRALVDSRPFQIFEGSNDILYAQIAETLLKRMQVAGETNLRRYLAGFELTARAVEPLAKLLEVGIDPDQAQRKLVELGQLVSRVIAYDLVLVLGERGFNRELVAGSLATLEQELAGLLAHYRVANLTGLVALDQEHPSWRDYCG